jgi:hypothetical protein
MNRRSAKVVLLHRESSSMADDWINHIEVRRDANANLSVWGNRYGENPVTGNRRWFDWESRRGLRSPVAVSEAVEAIASFLATTIDWAEATPLLASVDWLTAAVLARKSNLPIPALPGVDSLLQQRSLRVLGKVTIGAEWGYDLHELSMPFERWVRIVAGEPWSSQTPYRYEGQRFMAHWSFDRMSRLDVTYDDGGEGWSGQVEALELITGPVVDDVDLARLVVEASRQTKRVSPKARKR